jgi:hypothetical protein
MSLIDRGIRLLNVGLAREARPLTVTRGATTATWSAVPGRTETGFVDPNTGMPTVEKTDRDVIGPAPYPFDEPQPGDRIADWTGTYEVLNLAHGRCWAWIGPHNSLLRVHTKRVSNP